MSSAFTKDFGPMATALDMAILAGQRRDVPVGAVIVRDGQVIAAAGNQVEQDHDPTAHAEILVLRQASTLLATPRLVDCDLYVTLEPCAMCAQAIALARVKTLYFGAFDPKGGAVDHGPQLYRQPTCHHRPEVYGGIDERRCAALLTTFFKELRE